MTIEDCIVSISMHCIVIFLLYLFVLIFVFGILFALQAIFDTMDIIQSFLSKVKIRFKKRF